MKLSIITILLLLSTIDVKADFLSYWVVGINSFSVIAKTDETVLIYRLNDQFNDTLNLKYIICGQGTSSVDIDIRDSNDSLIFSKRYDQIGEDKPILIPLKKYVDLKIKRLKIFYKEVNRNKAKFSQICELRFDDEKNGRTLK